MWKEIRKISGHPILGSLSYVTYFRVGRYGSTNMSSSLPTWPSTWTTTHRTSVWHTNDRLPVNSDPLNVSVASWLLILPDPQRTLSIPSYVSSRHIVQFPDKVFPSLPDLFFVHFSKNDAKNHPKTGVRIAHVPMANHVLGGLFSETSKNQVLNYR